MSGLFAQQNPWGASPQPTPPLSGYGTQLTQPPLQQLVHSLLVVPQQLQHLLQLAQIQQYQVQYLLQSIPQQIQQLQQQLSFSPQSFAPQSFAPQHALGIPQIPFGGPQPFGGQPGYLM